MKTILLTLLTAFTLQLFLLGNGQKLQAQATNCNNLNFSYNSFTFWTGKTGIFIQKTSSTPDPYQLTSGVITAGSLPAQVTGSSCASSETNPRRFFINTDVNEYDKNVRINGNYMLKKIPAGYTSSVRLGNACAGAEAEALYYDVIVSEQTALLTLMYAMVLQTPHGGPGEKHLNPSFNVEVRDKFDNLIKCTEYTVYSYLPDILAAGDTTFELFNGGGMLYRKWMPLVMNLKPYIGEQIKIRVAMGDCTLGGHYGYMYLTGKCGSDEVETGSYVASDSDTAAFAEAPFGLTYRWVFSGEDPDDPATRIISTERKVYLTDEDFGMRASVNLDCYMQMLVPGGGCPSKVQKTIDNKKPMVDFKYNIKCNRIISFDSAIIKESSIALDESTHNWDFGDGSTSNVKHPTHQYDSSGFYTIVYSVSTQKDGADIYTTTKRTTVFIPKDPIAKVNAPTGACPGEEVTLTSIGSDADTLKWIYNGQEFRDPSITLSFDTTSVVDLVAINSSKNACTDTVRHTVRIKNPPIVGIIGDSLICKGNTVTLAASSDNGVEYAWTHGKEGATIHEKPNGTVTYSVTATNDIGCSDTATFYVKVIAPEITASRTKICPGDTVTLTASSAYQYEWASDPKDETMHILDTTNTVVTAVPQQTTTYYLTGFGQNGCRADVLNLTVVVYPYPIPTIENTPDFIDSENPAILFKDQSPYGIKSYWEFGDGTSSDRRTITHLYQDLSKDTIIVYLKSTNEIGCWRDTTKHILVSLFSVWAPNAFTPEKEGANSLFRFYTKNELASFKLVIFDRWGQKVFETKDIKAAWDGTSKGNPVPAGNYIWVMNYKRPGSDRLYEQKGNINLVR